MGTFGRVLMERLLRMKILIVGMRGLGVETAKNIILSGAYSVDIHDPNIVQINDLGSNFYLKEEDVGKKNRDEASFTSLSKLNQYVKISVLKLNSKINTDEYQKELCELIQKKNYDIIVFTEIQTKQFLTKIDEECRKNNVKFIYSGCFGLTGFIFSDFGTHTIINENGKYPKSYYVKSITKDKNGIVTIDTVSNTESLDLGDGDFVQFKGVDGMKELNDINKIFRISIESCVSFSIGDTSNYGNYIKDGIVTEVKIPKEMKYADYKTRAEIMYDRASNFYTCDYSKGRRNVLLFLTLSIIQDYYSKNNFQLPKLNDINTAKEILILVKKKYDEVKNSKIECFQNMDDFDEKIALNTIRWASAQICPITAFFGAIIAQEIIKTTGFYTPLNQWLIIDFFEMVENIPENADRNLKNCRYDEQIAIFGNEIQKKIEESNFFMVGAGATGCEYLKNFAMMGASNSPNSKYVLTDNDNIEISNLSRQFLFRREDIGLPKSEVAKRETKLMNPNFNVEAMTKEIVENDTDNNFNYDFWESQNFIIYAVDSVQARCIIDKKVIEHTKCGIDAGTKGVEAQCHIIVPFKTNSYLDEAVITERKELPFCTLRYFPSRIEHCIEWARDAFEGYFSLYINDTKKFFVNNKELKEMFYESKEINRLEAVKEYIFFIVNKNLEQLVEYSMKIYSNNFDFNIQSLLKSFPENYKSIHDGQNLWGSSKIRPHPIPFDANDDKCITYIQKYLYILTHALGLGFSEQDLSKENLKKIASKVKLADFSFKELVIKENGNVEEGQDENTTQIILDKINKIFEELDKIDIKSIDVSKIEPEKFEKDNDENCHIDFIHLTANLRAKNYNIDECERNRTKIISGKIIPSILTSSAAIAAISSLQVFTILQTHERKYLRKCYFHLGLNQIILQPPPEPKYKKDQVLDKELQKPVKVIPDKWSEWDTIEIKNSLTCGELIDYLVKKYNIEIEIIVSGDITLYNSLFPAQKRLERKIEDIYLELSKKKN